MARIPEEKRIEFKERKYTFCLTEINMQLLNGVKNTKCINVWSKLRQTPNSSMSAQTRNGAL